MWEKAYLEWSSHNSTSVAGGLMVGGKGDAIDRFLPREGGGLSTWVGKTISGLYTKGLEAACKRERDRSWFTPQLSGLDPNQLK